MRLVAFMKLVLIALTGVTLAACGSKSKDPATACSEAAKRGVDAMINQARGRLAASQLPEDVRARMLERQNRLEGAADQTVASVVSRDRNGKVIVGEPARRNLLDDAANNSGNNTVIEIKREMGEPFRRTTPDSAGNVEKYGAQHYYEECLAEARRAAVSHLGASTPEPCTMRRRLRSVWPWRMR